MRFNRRKNHPEQRPRSTADILLRTAESKPQRNPAQELTPQEFEELKSAVQLTVTETELPENILLKVMKVMHAFPDKYDQWGLDYDALWERMKDHVELFSEYPDVDINELITATYAMVTFFPQHRKELLENPKTWGNPTFWEKVGEFVEEDIIENPQQAAQLLILFQERRNEWSLDPEMLQRLQQDKENALSYRKEFDLAGHVYFFGDSDMLIALLFPEQFDPQHVSEKKLEEMQEVSDILRAGKQWFDFCANAFEIAVLTSGGVEISNDGRIILKPRQQELPGRQQVPHRPRI